jgi:hypothetical protein
MNSPSSPQPVVSGHRPLGVWLTAGMCILAGLSALFVDFVAIQANIPNGQILTSYYPSLAWFSHLLTWALNGLLIYAGVLLFRLRSRTTTVFSLYIVGLLISQLWFTLSTDWFHRYGLRGMANFTIGVIIFVLIRSYAQRITGESAQHCTP